MYSLIEGDLLACRFNGNLRFVGRFALYRGNCEEARVYPDKLIRFRIDRKRMLPEFVRFAMNSPIGREVIESFCATTAGNIGISATDLKTIPVPSPSLQEQRAVVEQIDDLQVRLFSASSIALKAAKEIDAMLSAFLDREFRGNSNDRSSSPPVEN
jgi:type I restriction enzyme, S subunit